MIDCRSSATSAATVSGNGEPIGPARSRRWSPSKKSSMRPGVELQPAAAINGQVVAAPASTSGVDWRWQLRCFARDQLQQGRMTNRRLARRQSGIIRQQRRKLIYPARVDRDCGRPELFVHGTDRTETPTLLTVLGRRAPCRSCHREPAASGHPHGNERLRLDDVHVHVADHQ